jgi:chitinase
MGSLIKFHFPRVGLLQNIPKPYPRSSMVSCGLRGGPRKPLWRKTMLSSKSIQAVHSLKLARSSAPILQQVFNARLTRLLKADLLDTLAELQRQNHLDLVLQVFWMEKVVGLVVGKIMKYTMENYEGKTKIEVSRLDCNDEICRTYFVLF